jgi:frataxin
MLKLIRLYRFSVLAEQEFLQLAELEFDRLASIAEQYEDREMDISHSHNILSVRARNRTIVVNTQTPNRQLWYSSPISGPQRYNWQAEKWMNGQEKELA